MLIEFRVKNYKSISDEQVLSMVASPDDSLEQNVIKTKNFSLLSCAVIYGPNASGKSNLINALKIFLHLVRRSTDLNDNSQSIIPFKLDSENLDLPTIFEISFILENIRFQYGFSIKGNKILEETLIAYPKNYAQIWFERKFNFKKNKSDWKWSTYLKGGKESLANKTREDSLFITVAKQWNHEQLVPIYNWISNNLRVLSPHEELLPITEMNFFENKVDDLKYSYMQLIKDFLIHADLGIKGIKIAQNEQITKDDESGSQKRMSDSSQKIKKEKKLPIDYEVNFIHKNTSGEDVFFNIDEESDGTRRLFSLIGPWIETVLNGYTVFIDEIETSLHPILTRKLIEFISTYNVINNPQLIFTTHDTTLLDPELFRRDQIWFMEKDDCGSSNLYSLADYKEGQPRKNEAMQKRYLAGRYGAIPIIKSFEIHEKK